MVKAVTGKVCARHARVNARFARLRALVADFRSNRRGNVAVISAVAALPMVAAVGCVIDYTNASMIKTKLQAAADAASLATVSVNSQRRHHRQSHDEQRHRFRRLDLCDQLLQRQSDHCARETPATPISRPRRPFRKAARRSPRPSPSRRQVPTYFMAAWATSTVSVSGTSTASYTLPTYINFYLMLDVSGLDELSLDHRRAIAAAGRQSRQLTALYPNGCTFACHFTAQGACPQSEQESNVPPPKVHQHVQSEPGRILPRIHHFAVGHDAATALRRPTARISRQATSIGAIRRSPPAPRRHHSCIQLRADAVGYAVTQLLSTANSAASRSPINSRSASIRSSNISIPTFR